MLSLDAIQVAEEEVVESTSNRFEDIYTFVGEGCYPPSMSPKRKKNLKRYAQKFIIDGGRLYYVGPKKDEKREVVIEADRKRQIFLESHFNEVGHHLGQKKTVNRIQSKYYWLGIVKDVVDWIKDCDTCQHTERAKNMARIIRPIKVDGPWEIVALEILGPFPKTAPAGNMYAVVITDYFSRWVEVFPIQRKDSLSVAKSISSSIYRFGPLKIAYLCQESDFCDEVSKHLRNKWNIAQKVLPVDEPQRNALYDQSSCMLRDAIKNVVSEKQQVWDDFLDPVLSFFRSTTNYTTKLSPFFLMFNRKASMPFEISQMEQNVLDREILHQSPSHDEGIRNVMVAMQEQQNNIKALVLSNMNAAYRQEKKSAKRRSRNSICRDSGQQSPPSKKLKTNLFLSFPTSTMLTGQQNGTVVEKSDSECPLSGPVKEDFITGVNDAGNF